jgi:predicted secreted protein
VNQLKGRCLTFLTWRKKMKKILVSLLLFFGSSAMAEDTAFINFLGFSNSGKYMAFQEAVLMDGSGDYVSAIRILDVANDQYVDVSKDDYSSETTGVSKTYASFVNGAQKKAAKMLTKWGIDKNKGQVVHVSVAPRLSTFTYKNKYVGMFLRTKTVDMSNDKIIKPDALKERLALCETMSEPDRVTYPAKDSLVGYEVQAFSFDTMKTDTTLHSDMRVPLSRYCPYDYSLNSAYAYGNQVVLLVSYNSVGFEGPDTQFVTVPFDISQF